MDKDLSELTEYLSQKFDNVDGRFNELAKVFATKEDLKEAVSELSTKTDFNNLLGAVDAYAKKADSYFQEMVMLSHKVDRHEKWLHLVAEKLGIKLEY
jgi:ATP phosphoribosyltransferase regulatory subunit HisZ